MASSTEPTDLFPFLDENVVPVESSPAAPLVEAAFYDENLPALLSRTSWDRLDEAPFGIIHLNQDGVVQAYNQFEAQFSGRSASGTIGRNFFQEVAPCTQSRFFRGRYQEGLAKKDLDVTFSYTFTYRMRPTIVDVRMIQDLPEGGWVLIRPKAGAAA